MQNTYACVDCSFLLWILALSLNVVIPKTFLYAQILTNFGQSPFPNGLDYGYLIYDSITEFMQNDRWVS